MKRKSCAEHRPERLKAGRGHPETRQNLSPRTGRPLVVLRNASIGRRPLRNSRPQARHRSWLGVATLVLQSFRAHSRMPSKGWFLGGARICSSAFHPAAARKSGRSVACSASSSLFGGTASTRKRLPLLK